jgi:folate-binding protein YgfZ
LLIYLKDRVIHEKRRLMPIALLPHRGIIRVSGPEASQFLDNLLTVSVAGLGEGGARFGALLTPQGKIVVDGCVTRVGDAFLIDCSGELAADFAKKLGFYRLRAQVEIANLSDEMTILAFWGGSRPVASHGAFFADPRLADLGLRQIVNRRDGAKLSDADMIDYHLHRVDRGVPEGGFDFGYGDAFPHEADMDQLHGIDFHKGCYVGQEVVSRMEHRATARTRCVPIRFVNGSPYFDSREALAGDKPCGSIGTVAPDDRAIALLRLDRVAEALAAGQSLSASGYEFVIEARDWIGFDLPRAETDNARNQSNPS